MRGYLLALVCVLAVAGELSASVSSSSSLAWRRYKSEHAKVYGPEEDAIRFDNFLATKQVVERHNANPNATYKMRLNHLADWTREERQQLTGLELTGTQRPKREDSFSPELAKLLDGPVPKEVDWRQVPNRVTPVKDQGKCNSGYAFAATGLLEGQQAVLNMSGLISLSEQQLLDCSQINHGCHHGFLQEAVEDIDYYDGIQSGSDYLYEAKRGLCRIDERKFVMTTTGTSCPTVDEEELSKIVANYGPVAVSILATHNFHYYDSGVFDDPLCFPDTAALNHNVLLVGYGTDPKGGDYWLVKNSWGTKWGEEGYIKMRRGINMCGITDNAILAKF